jgi:hypothetical protein
MMPIVNGLAEKYGDRMSFQRLNAASEGQTLFQQYGLRGHPAYIILDEQGNEVWRQIGPVRREVLEQAIQRALE